MNQGKEAGSGFMAMIEIQVRTNWFELETRTRRDYAKQIKEIVSRYPNIRFRWFDAEAWTGSFTDFVLCEFADLDSYNSLWGELRRHPFLSTPFAHISRVTMGMEIKTPEPVVPSAVDPAEEPEPVAPAEVGEAKTDPAPAQGTPMPPEDPDGRIPCLQCGRALRPTARFCSGCGHPAGPPPSPSGTVSPEVVPVKI